MLLVRQIPNLNTHFTGFRQEFVRARVISNRWLGRSRNIPRYGDQTTGVAPRTLYLKREVNQALSDARETFCLLLRIEKKLKLTPFGEAYPERDVKLRPIFEKIKDYVWGGGVFVSAGGFAFFYAWDVKQGLAVPISESRTLIPRNIAVHQHTRQIIVQQYTSALEFTGTLLWKELGALTTGETNIHQGAYTMTTMQNRSDINKVGNLRTIGGTSTIQEFRALRDESLNLIPLLRGNRPDFGDVYPIAAIKYGYGYFLICGMHIVTNAEFEKAIVASEKFLKWFLSRP